MQNLHLDFFCYTFYNGKKGRGYDYENYQLGIMVPASHSAYGAICLGTAVCQGYAYAYDYKLNTEGRTLELNVIGLDGNNNTAGGAYSFTAGNIYKLNLQFTEENVKDQDQLCVEVTVAIQPWTIVDNLKAVFGN